MNRDGCESELKKQSDLFKVILDSLAEGVLVIDKDMRVVMANSRFFADNNGAVLVEGKFCHGVSHKLERPCFENGLDCPVKDVFESGMPQETVHIHTHKDGSPRHVSIKAYPVKDAGGRVFQVVETITDITEKETAMRELQEKVGELEEFYDMAVGRELKMIELKDEIEGLKRELDILRSRRH